MNSTYLSINEVCNILSISQATCRNWVRLNKLAPVTVRPLQFDQNEIALMKEALTNGTLPLLASRRNKTYITGNSFYKDYLHEDAVNLPVIENILDSYEQSCPGNDRFILVLAEYALQLLNSAWSLYQGSTDLLSVFLSRPDSFSFYRPLIQDLLDLAVQDQEKLLLSLHDLDDALQHTLTFVPGQDYLGLLYLSLQNIGGRKANGAYYTPSRVVDSMTRALTGLKPCKAVIDPCCGTGNFLISLLVNGHTMTSLYGLEKDALALSLARINLALHQPLSSLSPLYQNLQCADTLKTSLLPYFSCILGNPPWGSSFSADESRCLGLLYDTAAKKPDSSALFFEHALRNAAKGCLISFVLPSAFLTVASYEPVRSLLLKTAQIIRIVYLDNVFSGVLCPSIILTVRVYEQGEAIQPSALGTEIVQKDRRFIIAVPRPLSSSCINLTATDEEYSILGKMEQLPCHTTLRNQAYFALGIVTGNNNALLSDAPGPDREMIYKGKNIQKYKITPSDLYVETDMSRFQQKAPLSLYRAPEKLLYRFINNTLVFAYDDRQRLTLNSCNILIPDIQGLHIKYILAVLNSAPVAFYYTHKFNSVKILRSHLEQIPIPVVSDEIQSAIIALVEQIESEKDPEVSLLLQKQADQEIRALYQLD